MTPLATVIAGGEVWTPNAIGHADIVVSGGRVAAVGGAFDERAVGSVVGERVDANGLVVIPGLVDGHVHFLGGGGGDGFDSRIPELQLSDLTRHGITTAVAPLGVDPVSRSLEGLLAKARALTQEGITAFAYTGGFNRPLPSLTGATWRDAYLIPDVRGIKLAIGVERAPTHAARELVDLSRELLWVERATGRTQVLHVHLGPLEEGHQVLLDAAPDLADPARLVVTHCNRSDRHLATAIGLAQRGAWTDMTCMISPDRGMPGSVPASWAVLHMADHGASLDRVTLSTDGNGSVTEPDGVGGWLPYRTHMDSLLAEIRALVTAGMPLADAVALGSRHPAEALGLSGKGTIEEGADADLVLLDADYVVRGVFARGRQMVRDGRAVILGRYERRES